MVSVNVNLEQSDRNNNACSSRNAGRKNNTEDGIVRGRSREQGSRRAQGSRVADGWMVGGGWWWVYVMVVW